MQQFPTEYCIRKANQHYEMAGLARADGDTADAERHLKLAKAWDKKANATDGEYEIKEATRMRLAAEFSGKED
jgi:hypothetical protein